MVFYSGEIHANGTTATVFTLDFSGCGNAWPTGDLVVTIGQSTPGDACSKCSVVYGNIGPAYNSKLNPYPDANDHDYSNLDANWNIVDSFPTITAAQNAKIYISVTCPNAGSCDSTIVATLYPRSTSIAEPYNAQIKKIAKTTPFDLTATPGPYAVGHLYPGYSQQHVSMAIQSWGPQYLIYTCPSFLQTLWGTGTVCLSSQVTGDTSVATYQQLVTTVTGQSIQVPRWNQRPENYNTPSADLSGNSVLNINIMLTTPASISSGLTSPLYLDLYEHGADRKSVV